MFKLKFFAFLIFAVLLNSCSKESVKENIIKEKSLESQVIEAYKEGMESLDKGDVLFAAKKFNEAEILFPQGEWAPKSALMASYSYYIQDYYSDAIAELERFIVVYPQHKDLQYAYYLLAICHYEQIVDEKKDTFSILKAKEYFEYINTTYPNTEYSIDASFKIGLINDILAAKELYIGRYYVNKKKWIPAINRFKNVVNDYDTTIYVEEALYRLVEVYYLLGLKEESKKYAKILGYNYNSSEWFERAYKVLNKDYKIKKKVKPENNDSFFKKIIDKIK